MVITWQPPIKVNVAPMTKYNMGWPKISLDSGMWTDGVCREGNMTEFGVELTSVVSSFPGSVKNIRQVTDHQLKIPIIVVSLTSLGDGVCTEENMTVFGLELTSIVSSSPGSVKNIRQVK